mmetsp:Transcript_7264/g.29608  ORF Transcript_7264/g.29608 Transcript_7264/m.29608 type:complete len:262 (-) Transcript_7264:198-983(-)
MTRVCHCTYTAWLAVTSTWNLRLAPGAFASASGPREGPACSAPLVHTESALITGGLAGSGTFLSQHAPLTLPAHPSSSGQYTHTLHGFVPAASASNDRHASQHSSRLLVTWCSPHLTTSPPYSVPSSAWHGSASASAPPLLPLASPPRAPDCSASGFCTAFSYMLMPCARSASAPARTAATAASKRASCSLPSARLGRASPEPRTCSCSCLSRCTGSPATSPGTPAPPRRPPPDGLPAAADPCTSLSLVKSCSPCSHALAS